MLSIFCLSSSSKFYEKKGELSKNAFLFYFLFIFGSKFKSTINCWHHPLLSGKAGFLV
jgi:hypothetical protein